MMANSPAPVAEPIPESSFPEEDVTTKAVTDKVLADATVAALLGHSSTAIRALVVVV